MPRVRAFFRPDSNVFFNGSLKLLVQSKFAIVLDIHSEMDKFETEV